MREVDVLLCSMKWSLRWQPYVALQVCSTEVPEPRT